MWRSELDRRILLLALPALGALVVEPLYTLTDTAIVGHLGRAPLGGLAVASTVLNLLGWTSAFLEMATTSRVASRRGAAGPDAVAAAAASAYAVAAVLGVLLAAAVAVGGPALAAVLGARGAIENNAASYLRISAVGLPFLLLTLAGTGHLQGHEDVRTPLRIVLVANLVNVALEIALVYGFGTGIRGSAWGTVAAQVVAAALFVHASHRRTPLLRRPPGAEVRLLLRQGVALVVRTVALGAALAASTALAAHVGAVTLAGHQIALQVWLLLALVLDALAVPAQVFVAAALGRGDIAAATAVGRRCLRLALGASVAVGAGTVALSPVLPRVFIDDGHVWHVATVGLLLCGAMQPLAALAFTYDGLLLGASDYATLRRAMLLALLAFAPLAVATAMHPALGIAGIWSALLCWLAARSALLARRWSSRRWAVTPA